MDIIFYLGYVMKTANDNNMFKNVFPLFSIQHVYIGINGIAAFLYASKGLLLNYNTIVKTLRVFLFPKI